MQRGIEVLHVLTQLVVITAAIYVGLTAVRTLERLHRDLLKVAIRVEEVLREHREYLEEHERRMERLSHRP